MIFIDPNLPPSQRRESLIKLVETLDSMIRHPGFLALDAYYKSEEEAAFTALQTATTGDIAMKAAGAYVAIKRIRELPKSYLLNAAEELKKY